jgi:hypothetical protein
MDPTGKKAHDDMHCAASLYCLFAAAQLVVIEAQ